MQSDRTAKLQKSKDLSPMGCVRTGFRKSDLKQSFVDSLFCNLGRTPSSASNHDRYLAMAIAIRDRVLKQGVRTLETFCEQDARVVSYLSAEFLPGPHLANNLLSLGITEQAQAAATELGCDFDALLDQEEEPGLGNGGLGRLASCFMDSLATLEVPAIGYGIRYEFGIFDQEIRDGHQVEITDKWLRFGNPWEIARPEHAYDVKFGGSTEVYTDENGHTRVKWHPKTVVKGVAYDTPILGYGVGTCNRLRLWKAEAVESFDFGAFNHGDYYRAVEEKVVSENITKVLYPNDEVAQGKTLRLQQQYFFVTCSLQDMIRVHLLLHRPLEKFHEKWAVQLNDTHPAIAIAELMRLLVDEHKMDWDTAWHVTKNTCAYTNHTLLPEALEKWPVEMFQQMLPRHLEIIYELNHRFLMDVQEKFGHDPDRLSRLSLIDESGKRYIRMANLATLGSSKVNGVAQLHSDLLKQTVLRDFAEMWPEKFCNVTNGVTPRRFIALANPPLATLISRHIGDNWLYDLTELKKLEPLADEPSFRKHWQRVKLTAKQKLAGLIQQRTGLVVDPTSMFDIQVKRIHEYKRQHLNILHVIALYHRIKRNPTISVAPRTFIFGGKAAPGYYMAKLIIRLINGVAEVVNNDPDVNGRLKVVFFPDFNVKNAQPIYPAADLSEQISLAGKEASGTGNMKFSMNGALTIGTLDGANVEIREEVGAENFFLFGLTANEVLQHKASGYNPRPYFHADGELNDVVNLIGSGVFSRGDTSLFRSLADSLRYDDPYLLAADFRSYMDAQSQVSTAYSNPDRWTRMSILNVARIGKFSSDRSIQEYCDMIWKVQPVIVD